MNSYEGKGQYCSYLLLLSLIVIFSGNVGFNGFILLIY